ncbi:MAG TPA: GNAT family N-acetyltransferase [Candidatus Binatia bacterium]|nr:GNAT family N-acetyltransferase [Candidatus Binatia bacterium]
MPDGTLLQVNVSDGGVPKLPVPTARVTSGGVEGDRQREITVHGGPHRAVSILGIEAIRRVAAEGHPIAPGTTGENLTTEGFDVSALPVGTRLAIGGEVVLELSAPTNPCRTIRHSFTDLRFGRLAMKAHPADSRMYARVVREGVVRPGDPITLSPPADDAAERFRIADRLDGAERESSVAFWKAAADAGISTRLLYDGEVAVAATPSVPGPAFNLALGFAHLPNLVDLALEHFRRHGVSGWVLTDDPPWPGAEAETVFARWAVPADALAAEPPPAGVVVRELARDEVGAWGRVVVEASDLPPDVSRAWTRVEPELARAAHHHRFVAELDGRPVAAGSVHVHRGVGWLRAGSVLPAFRGRGLQRALIVARAAHAARAGCDLIGASTVEDGASARNVTRLGFERAGTRRSYPAVAPRA